MDKFDKLEKAIELKIPKFKIKYKNESFFQKFLSRILFFVPKYMTQFTTTLGNTVWFPSKDYVARRREDSFDILSHEYVHLLDRREDSFFEVKYLFPQILALLSLQALIAIWSHNAFLIFLVFLVSLFPWPSNPRAKIEKRGYSMNIALAVWKKGHLPRTERDHIAESFVSYSYYAMYPFPEKVLDWIDNTVASVKNREIFKESPAFVDVYAILVDRD